MESFLRLVSAVPVWLLLIFSASGVISGDYFAKSWSEGKESWKFALSILGYLCSGLFYIPTLLRQQLVITSIIWSFLSIIGFLVIGFLIFKETFNTIQIVGIVLGVASLIVFAFSGH